MPGGGFRVTNRLWSRLMNHNLDTAAISGFDSRTAVCCAGLTALAPERQQFHTTAIVRDPRLEHLAVA